MKTGRAVINGNRGKNRMTPGVRQHLFRVKQAGSNATQKREGIG